ncbi:MAG: hypothetical protein Q7T80_14240 [Methanoregula sp.]|nr:hypothetical protein [Methanoregula sp.]
MTTSAVTNSSEKSKQRYLELAIPLFSFGATFAGILLWNRGIEINFQFFAIGCVIGSCLLAYLAWCRPKKDIVALSTPIYAFIFFVVPTDYMSGLVLQLLYAASLTLLLIRLKYRFGQTHTTVSLGTELAAPLQVYVGQTQEAMSGISSETAHRAAVVISQFSTGEYGQAARTAGMDSGQPVPLPGILSRAFAIVHEQATILDGSQSRPETYRTFLPEDEVLLAKPLLLTDNEDRKFDAMLDNALFLLLSAAWNFSETDRQHLLSCQAFLSKLIEE